ncbi:MAG TPA: tripartite tricarboxylate transporter substrate binding protein [Burkholderiales bacterium]|nr:tripartite tricarboxylate transporter substrate binding protein [Burkholderiales bacterium]
MRTARSLIVLVCCAGLALIAGETLAQSGPWPNRPIRFVVPLPPGGSPDYLSRLLAERLQPVLGQPLVVENKPGAAGNIARDFVAKAPADGYTILMSESAHVMSAAVVAKLPYDPIKDFEPISLVATIPFGLTVNSSMPVHTLKEFIAYTKSAPRPLTYGTAGIGAPHHFAVELLRSMTGIDVIHVPYKGSAGIIPALLSGEIDFTIAAVNSLLPHFKSGKLRPIAMAGSSRTAILPDVPTIAEAGPLPGYAVDVWLGVMAPAGTPRPIIDRLNTEINRVVRDPQIVKERLNTVGLEAVGTTPEQLLEVMKADLVKYAKLAREAQIKPE